MRALPAGLLAKIAFVSEQWLQRGAWKCGPAILPTWALFILSAF
jgi:hypothetical protein